jgi:DNA-binding beta-propeller fold protein YncE
MNRANTEGSALDGLLVDRWSKTLAVGASRRAVVRTLDGFLAAALGRLSLPGVSKGYGKGQFSSPQRVAVSADGNVYVTDSNNSTVQRFSADGDLLQTWGDDGTGLGQFKEPLGVAVAANGDVYVTDQELHRIQRFEPA